MSQTDLYEKDLIKITNINKIIKFLNVLSLMNKNKIKESEIVNIRNKA